MTEHYVLEKSEDGINVVLTAEWSADAARPLLEGRADGLMINYAKGFKGNTLDFLTSDLPIRRLYILDRTITNVIPIQRLSDHLRYISFEAAPGVTLNKLNLPNLKSVEADWKVIDNIVRSGCNLEWISICKYNEKDLVPLCAHTQLRMLQIKDAPKLESLTGLRSLNQLITLRLLWAIHLQDLTELQWLSATLRELRMERCKSVKKLDDIGKLENLRILEFGDGPSIPSLNPLSQLTLLEWAVLWGTTKVLDNDLTPLQKLPHLKVLRMQSRRAYSPSVAEIQAAIV